MSVARLVVTAVKELGQTKAGVARDYGVSRRWVHELIKRFDAEGEAGLEPRSRRPLRSPRQIAPELEEEIVRLRKDLADKGLDAGAHTICFRLTKRHRLLLGSDVRRTTKAADVVASFHTGFAAHGFPASVLTDNAAVFTATSRGGGRCAIEIELDRLGIAYRHSSPYHPQTCGKVERFHQTLKKWLAKQRRARTVEELQAQLDWFRAYYNDERPHRAVGRRPPAHAFAARPKVGPTRPGFVLPPHYRVRRDTVDVGGTVTLRYDSRLHHIVWDGATAAFGSWCSSAIWRCGSSRSTGSSSVS